MMRARVKICCIASIAEAMTAIDAGADALGLVGPMPSGPGIIDLAQAARIARAVPPPIATFLLTSATSSAALIEQARLCAPTALQLVDDVDDLTVYHDLRTALPALKLVQVVHVLGAESIASAQRVAPYVDALLLDSGNPNLAIKELGGTGRVHDWDTSAAIVANVRVPVFLAGGLSAANIASAQARVRPYGFDLCSGVRSEGHLDRVKLARFMAALHDPS